MKSFFFIPVSKLSKLNTIKSLSVDEIIIDFEDAILKSNIENYFNDLSLINDVFHNWFRVPVRNDYNSPLDLTLLERFNKQGSKKIVLPKLKSLNELELIISKFRDIEFMLLIEHPRLLTELRFGLYKNNELLKSLTALAIGSHDLLTFINAKHQFEQLRFPRQEILYMAKSYDLLAVDIASMEISNQSYFQDELKYGIESGFDGKFYIHPIQLEWYKKYLLTNVEQLNWANAIFDVLPSSYKGGDIVPFILNGKVIEKPHVIQALKILNKI